MSRSRLKEATKEISIAIVKGEKWLDKQVEIAKWAHYIVMLFLSFTLVFLIGLPGAMVDLRTSDINGFWDVVGKISFVRVFYSATITFFFFVIARKLKISVMVFGITYKFASKGLSFWEAWGRYIVLFVGAFAATVALTELSMWQGNFIEEFTPKDDGTGYYLGTSLGGVKPIMRGWFVINNEYMVTFHDNYAFYTARMFLEMFLIGGIAAGLLFYGKKNFRKHVWGRYLIWLIVGLIGFKFQAHSANIMRYIAGTSVMEIYGGYANWELLGFVITGHVAINAMIMFVVRCKKLPNIN